MGRYTLRMTCNEPHCKEWRVYECDTRREYADGQRRNARWLCTRHTNPEQVLSPAAPVTEHVMVSERGPLDHLYWGGGSGFNFGPGFKAWADDFPEGSRLIVTARVEPPAAGTPAQSDDQRQVREDSQGLGEPGRLSPDMVAADGGKPCGHCDAPPGTAHSSSCPDGANEPEQFVIVDVAHRGLALMTLRNDEQPLPFVAGQLVQVTSGEQKDGGTSK